MTFRLALVAALAAVSTATAKECDYFANFRCINPQATATATIPFSPLFTGAPPKFVYAIDELDEEEKAAQKKRNAGSIPRNYDGSILKAGFWLEYDKNSVNTARSQNRVYYTFALETSSTNPVGGDSGGCASLLGPECVRNLKLLIAMGTYGAPDGIDGGLGTVISGYYANPPQNLGCPADIFGTVHTPPRLDIPLLLNTYEPFARFGDEFVRDPLPSGNESFAHGVPQLRFRSFAEQAARGVVGVTVGWPVTPYGEEAKYPISDVTVETVCVRVGKNSGKGRKTRDSVVGPAGRGLWKQTGKSRRSSFDMD